MHNGDAWGKVDTLAAVEAGLSDEAKDILRERTDQLRKRRYGSYDYVAMLGWLQNTQHNNAHELREECIMETARSLMKGEDTELAGRLREGLSTWKKSFTGGSRSPVGAAVDRTWSATALTRVQLTLPEPTLGTARTERVQSLSFGRRLRRSDSRGGRGEVRHSGGSARIRQRCTSTV